MVINFSSKQIAKRVCLKCNEPFLSQGPGNRICGRCARINKKLGPIPEACLDKQRGKKRHNGLPMGLTDDIEDSED